MEAAMFATKHQYAKIDLLDGTHTFSCESFTASISSIRNHFEYCQDICRDIVKRNKGEQVIKLNAWIGCVSFL